MICFMPYECINWAFQDKDAFICNLTAIGQNVKALGLNNLEQYVLVNPDILYLNNISYDEFIFKDDIRFAGFFSIIEKLYNGKNVYILKSNTDIYDESIELLQRLIFGRYGYHSYIINNIEDIESVDKSYGSFNITGLENYNIDIQRYLKILNNIFG